VLNGDPQEHSVVIGFGSCFGKPPPTLFEEMVEKQQLVFTSFLFLLMSRFTEFYIVGLLVVGLLAGCAGYAALILYTADVHEVITLASGLSPHRQLMSSTQTEFEKLRLTIASGAIVLVVLASALALHLGRRGQFNYHYYRIGWHSLSQKQRRLALTTLAALTILRVIVSRTLATFDDNASYEYFVRKSLLTVSAYYPAPNNHVFSNTLSWLFYQIYPGYWWSMRVPVLLLSVLGTAGWFLGLLQRSNFRVALLATALFSFLELSLFYAAEGRGYALLLALSGLGFFCALCLTDSALEATVPRTAGAWSGLAISGIIGLYTVPTFAYFLVAAYSWVAFRWLRKYYYHRIINLCLLGVATLLGAALLYAPLLFVSGPASLFGNVYVKPLKASTFFRQLPAYLWEVEGAFMGESHNGVLASLHVGSLGALVVLLGFLVLIGAARGGRLLAHKATPILSIGVPALWFVLLPYTLMLVQCVQAPSRTLLFKAAFMFLLVGLEADWLLYQFERKNRHLRTALILGIGLWIGLQLTQLYRSNELRLSYLRTPHAAAQWLLKQPPGPVLSVDCSLWTLAAIQFYIHYEEPTSLLEIDNTPRPGIRYRYLIDPLATSCSPTSAALPYLHIDPGINNDAIDITARW
jgi:hypothetical protein